MTTPLASSKGLFISFLLLLFLLMPDILPGQAPTWTALPRLPSPVPDLFASHFFSRDSGFVCGRSSNGSGRLYRTINGGQSWTAVPLPGSPRALNDIFFLANTGLGTIVGDEGYLATTADSGTSWSSGTVANAWPVGGNINCVRFTSPLRGFIAGSAVTGNGPRLARTTDGGRTWQNVPLTGPQNNLYDLDFFDAQNGITVGTGKYSRKSVTVDSGATWESNAVMQIGHLVNGDTVSVSMYGVDAISGSGVAFASGGKVYFPTPTFPEVRKTLDFGLTWTVTALCGPSSGFEKPAYDLICLSENVVLVSARGGTVYRTDDGGSRWAIEAIPSSVGTQELRKFSTVPDGSLYLVGLNGTVLRYEPSPNVRFSSDSAHLGLLCPGSEWTSEITIQNTGTAALLLDSIKIEQPSDTTVRFVVSDYSSSIIEPGNRHTIQVRVLVAMSALPGHYEGSTWIRTNDERGVGDDTLRTIPLVVDVADRRLIPAGSQPLEIGQVRVGRTLENYGIDILHNVSPCTITIDSLYITNGSEFELSHVSRTILASGDRLSIAITFTPGQSCKRRDTVVLSTSAGTYRIAVAGDGVTPGFRTIPIDTLDLGSIEQGIARTATLVLANTLSNVCLDSCQVLDVQFDGPDAAAFSTPPDLATFPIVLAPDKDISVPITVMPTRSGEFVAYAIIRHDGPLGDTTTDTVVLTATGLKPELTTSVTHVRFAHTAINTTRDTAISEMLQNLRTVPVRITGIQITGIDRTSFRYDGATQFDLSSRSRRSLNLSFSPRPPISTAREYQAILEIQTDVPSTIEVPLSGIGEWENVSVLTTIVDMGSTSIRTCRDSTLTMFISNPGNVVANLAELRVVQESGGDADHTAAFQIVVPQPAAGINLLPGDSMMLWLRFCPQRLGLYRARLVVSSGSQSSPDSVLLTGSGLSNPILRSNTLQFAPTRVRTTRRLFLEQALVNNGSDSITIESFRIPSSDSAAFRIVDPQFPLVIPPGTNVRLTLDFSPPSRGHHSTRSEVTMSTGVEWLELYGFGMYPHLVIVPTDSVPVRHRINSTRDITVVIINNGDDSSTVDRMAFNTSNSFANPDLPRLPVSLLPGDSILARITFAPTAPCEHQVTFELDGEGVANVYSAADTALKITATGIAPFVRTADTTIDFGRQRVSITSDTTLTDFLINRRFHGDTICLDDTRVDSVVIVGRDYTSFELVDPMLSRGLPLPLGTSVSCSVKFHPTSAGLKHAALQVYFDGSTDSVRTVYLTGTGVGQIMSGLGPPQQGAPGDTVRIPITISGDISGLAGDTLNLEVIYRKPMLKLIRVRPLSNKMYPSLGADSMLPGNNAMSRVRIAHLGEPQPRSLAELEFLALLGDSLTTHVTIDSIDVTGRNDFEIHGSSVKLYLDNFCHPSRHLIRFDSMAWLKSTPSRDNQTIRIEYGVAVQTPLRLSVYNIFGGEVARLADGLPQLGKNEALLHTTSLPEGFYFCRLIAPNINKTIQLQVVR